MGIQWTATEIKEMYALAMTETQFYIHKQKAINSDKTIDKKAKHNESVGSATQPEYASQDEDQSQGNSNDSIDQLFSDANSHSDDKTATAADGSDCIEWTEDDITEMDELGMNETEYTNYKNLAGIDEYSIESSIEGVDMEEKDNEADKQGWYDEAVGDKEVEELETDTKTRKVKEMFEPRIKQEKKSSSVSQSHTSKERHHPKNQKDTSMEESTQGSGTVIDASEPINNHNLKGAGSKNNKRKDTTGAQSLNVVDLTTAKSSLMI